MLGDEMLLAGNLGSCTSFITIPGLLKEPDSLVGAPAHSDTVRAPLFDIFEKEESGWSSDWHKRS
jgi:hypothetical protein